MKTQTPKKLRTVTTKSAVKKKPSKPMKKVKLTKSDPDYYSKIGAISAKKRRMTSQDFSEMARLSHEKRSKDSYRGGRPKKQVEAQ